MIIMIRIVVVFVCAVMFCADFCIAACNSPDGITGDLTYSGRTLVCPGGEYELSADFEWAYGPTEGVDTETVSVAADAENDEVISISFSYGDCTLDVDLTVSDGTGDTTEGDMAISNFLQLATVISVASEADNWAILNADDLGGGIAGGCADAARHAYFSARLTQEIGAEDALAWGEAHETSNVVSCEDNNMDLMNNENGSEIGASNMDASMAEIGQLVTDAVLGGDLFVPGGDCVASNS